MKCQNCGHESKSATANFCLKCGAKLNQEAVLPETAKDLGKKEKHAEKSVSPEIIEEAADSAPELITMDELPSEDSKQPDSNEIMKEIPRIDEDLPQKMEEELEMIPETEKTEEPLVFEFNTAIEEDEDEENPLANGLPGWNIIPPNTTVRRKRSI